MEAFVFFFLSKFAFLIITAKANISFYFYGGKKMTRKLSGQLLA